MTHVVRLTPGTLLLIAGVFLMAYTVRILHGLPVLCGVVLLWLAFVECVVLNAWWLDMREVFMKAGRHARRTQ